MTTAIGQPEHPGRVRGAGRGVGIRQYFGPPSRNPLSMEDLEVITQRIQEQVTKKLSEQLEHKLKADLSQQFQEQVRQELASLGLLQQNTNIEPTPSSPINVSTKGNYATPDPSVEDNHTNIRDQCELYVDVDPPHLVAIGKVYNLGSTIHHKTIEDDNVRVVVEEVRDAEARVPLPTNEVQTVGQAPNQFIQWLRRLVKSISVKVFIINCLLMAFFIYNCNDLTMFTNIVLSLMFRLLSNLAKMFDTKGWNLNLVRLNAC